jgi:hypothetical protein
VPLPTFANVAANDAPEDLVEAFSRELRVNAMVVLAALRRLISDMMHPMFVAVMPTCRTGRVPVNK